MNKNLYRIVFNKARGMLMVVADIAASGRGSSGPSSGVGHTLSQRVSALSRLNFSLLLALGSVSVSAQAGIVADGSAAGKQQPTVINSANGTPQINIQTPNSNGVSHNKYSQFDVDGKGAILNNSHNATQTQLGGMVNGNPWLAKSEAKIILNEVNSRNPSQLNGVLEVAGKKAQIIIANPAGITCDGCGFINANRTTLTTGTPQFSNGQITGYDVRQGEIVIQGRGMDTTSQDSTDIIARAVKVNAGIWANDLKVTAGSNGVDAAHENISKTTPDAGTRPQLAVDVAQLGGMYAGKIRLIGTETGVGVRNAGTIGTSAGSVAITADGRIENSGAINSAQDLSVSASGGIQNSGVQYASGNTTLSTPADIVNSGTIAAAHDTRLTAASLNSTTSGVLAAGMNNDGKLGSTGNLTLTTSGQLSAHGQNLAAGSLKAQGTGVDLSQSQTWAHDVTATATTGNLSTAQGNIAAAQTLTLNTKGLLNNDGGKLEADRLLLGGSTLSNRNGVINQLGEQDLTLTQRSAIDNTGGTIASNGNNLTLSTARLANQQGAIIHAGRGKLALNAAQMDATGGTIASNGALDVQAKNLVLDNATTQADSITVNADSLSHRSGNMTQTGSGKMALTFSGGLDNSLGSMASNGDFVITAGSLNNQQGQLLSAGHALTLTSAGGVDNRSGFIAADGLLNISGSSLDNSAGLMQSGSTFTLDTHDGPLINQNSGDQGGIVSLGDLWLNSGNVDNQHGTVYSKGNALLSTGSWSNTSGLMAAGAGLNFSGGTLLNDNGGSIQSGGNLALDTHGAALSNTQNGTISSGSDLQLTSGNVNNQAGVVYSAGNAELNTGSWDNTAGLLAGVGSLTYNGSTLLNDNGGAVQSGGDLLLDTHGALLSNKNSGESGGITSQGNMTLNSGALDNGLGAIVSNQQLTLNVTEVNNDAGLLVALQGLNAATGALSNQGGAVQSGAYLRWNTYGNSLNNLDGLISAQSNLSLNAGEMNNQQGLLTSGGDFTLTSGALDNQNGQIAGKSDLTLNSSGINNQHGSLQSLGDMVLNATHAIVDNTAGLIQSARQMAINAQQVFNLNTHSDDQSLGIQAGNILVTADTFNNLNGDVLANNTASLNLSGQLDNSHGLITAVQQAQILASTVINSQGDIEAGNGLTINSDSLTGDGKLLSLGDMSVGLTSGFTNTGTIQANGNLDLTTSGAVTNQNLMQAGDTFTLHAASLNNSTDGELSAGTLDVDVSGTLTNRGLLDGYTTHLSAQTLNNTGTGRIYGDWLSIDTRTLNNSREGGTAATIAARQQLDMGVGTLNNSSHALIYSDGDMYLGGGLDENWLATGQAVTVNNHSATIESAGNMRLNVATLNNINDHFTTENVLVAKEHISEYNVDHLGSQLYNDNDYNISMYKDETWIICIEGVICNTTNGDKFTHYDYTRTITEDRVLESDPAQIISGGTLTINAGDVLNDKSQIVAGGNLNINATNLNNVKVPGERQILDEGTATRYKRNQGKGGDKPSVEDSDYTPPAIIQEISLNVSTVADHSQIGGSGLTVDARQNTTVSGAIRGGSGPGDIPGGAVGSVTIPGISGGPSMSLAPGKTFEVNLPGDNRVVRMVGPNTRIPDNSLFKSHPESNSPYLVETDPRFTNKKQWLSSDYMMNAFITDPNNIQKRLGDGFYEQRLIREQVVALTGQRYIGDTQSDEEQYKMLMDNGIAFGQLWGLKPGVALTPEQMSALTSDIVWMVSQTVQLPDGSTQQVLVPQVYAKVKAGDLDGSGALLAGRNVNLNLSGDLTNSGRISGKDSTQILANNINNLGGIISGNDVALQARTDINNIGGTIQGGDSLLAIAGRDINVTTTTRSAVSADGNFGRTSIDRIGSLSVSNDGGFLGMQAGRDVNLTAGLVSNGGENSQTTVIAGNNLNLNTVTTGSHDSLSWGRDDWLKRSQSSDNGTVIQGGGNVSMGAGNDVNITAGTVSANQQLTIQAGNDLNIVNGTASDSFEQYTKQTGNSSMTSKTTTVDHNRESNQLAVGSQLDGDGVTLSAGHDLLIQGSDVAATGDVTIQAGHDLTIASAEETSREMHMKKTTKSGLLSSGGIGFTAGTLKETTENDIQTISNRQSMVGSLQGDTILLAGNDYRQTGSTVSAPTGNVLIQGKSVTIEAAQNTYNSQYKHTVEQKGFTFAVNVPALQALQVAANAVKQTGKSGDDRINMLAAANAAWDSAHAATTMMDSAKAVMANGAQGAAQSVSVSLTYGESKQTNIETINTTTAQASKINAGKNTVIVATGGEHSDINIIGSDISGKQSTTLFADNNINIVAAEQQRHDHTDDHSSGWNAGVAASYGQGGAAFGITAGGQYGVGNGQGDEVTWRNSHVGDSGGLTSITSGGTTTLRGGQVIGEGIQITANNLNIESLQDTMKYQGKQMDMSGQVTVGYGFSASGSFNMSEVNADYASVQEQSGIFAGDDGYQINVNNHTDLKGGIITSNDIAERMGKNQLSTGTLAASDIENHSDFTGKGIGLSGGISVVGNGENGNNSGEPLVDKDMSHGIGYDHGSDGSTTRSGINTGNIVITKSDEQLAITGKTVAETIDAIKTDISTETAAANSSKLDNNFDKDGVFKELNLQVNVTKEFKDNAYNQVDSYIDSKQADARADLKKAMDNHDDAARDKALDEIYKLQYQRRFLQTLIGVVAGSPGAAITQGTLATAATAMREESVKNSFLFGGTVDKDGRVLSNLSGDSDGLYDGIKIGGVRVGLDFVCGKGNERCQTDAKNNLVYDAQGHVNYTGDMDHPTFDKLLEDKTLSAGLYGPTGGFQGGAGSMGPISYTPGSFFDDLVESYAGTHDLIGGQLPGFYDNSGNTARGRSSMANLSADTWTIAAIPIATPFAMSELISPELLQFIFTSGK